MISQLLSECDAPIPAIAATYENIPNVVGLFSSRKPFGSSPLIHFAKNTSSITDSNGNQIKESDVFLIPYDQSKGELNDGWYAWLSSKVLEQGSMFVHAVALEKLANPEERYENYEKCGSKECIRKRQWLAEFRRKSTAMCNRNSVFPPPNPTTEKHSRQVELEGQQRMQMEISKKEESSPQQFLQQMGDKKVEQSMMTTSTSNSPDSETPENKGSEASIGQKPQKASNSILSTIDNWYRKINFNERMKDVVFATAKETDSLIFLKDELRVYSNKRRTVENRQNVEFIIKWMGHVKKGDHEYIRIASALSGMKKVGSCEASKKFADLIIHRQKWVSEK
ncbi:hypothetical protein B9Z55_025424 [Caenorhabditis nigoni]|uniref:Uncharacterized protein n=1 Tax=Caenorhabditis nigoni TaxID=1611254 RepID=A0A2G5SYV2_9PELO|nr:hypothetical protein B9Z55_025424 [Caenorhabditis nigoni]